MITAFLLLPIRTWLPVLMLSLLGQVHASVQALPDSLDEQYGIAAGYYERGEYVEAIQAFRQLIQSHPDSAEATMSHFFLGESLLQTRDHRAAYPAYQIFLKRMPDHPHAKRTTFRLAECAFHLDWQEQAVQLLERFIERYPNDQLNEFALNYLGEIRLRRREPQLARRVFEKSLEMFPESPQSNRSRFGLAKSLQQMGEIDQAIRFYQLMKADRASEFFGMSRMQLGIIAFDQNDFAGAKEYLKTAADSNLSPQRRVELDYWLAKTAMVTGSADTAFDYLARIADSQIEEPLKAAILFDGAVAAARIQEFTISLQWLHRLQATWPDSQWVDDAMLLEIELLYKQQLFDDALDRVAEFQRQYPLHQNLPQVIEYRGRIQYDRQNFQATIDTFQSLIEDYGHQSDHVRLADRWRYLSGLGHLGLQHFELAADTFAAIAAHQDDMDLSANLLLAKAAAAAGLEQPGQARVFLEQFLAINTTGDQADRARGELAIACALDGDWQTATSALSELERTSPDTQRVLEISLALAEYALRSQRFEDAEQRFTALANPGNPRFFVVRGLSGVAWTRMNRGDAGNPVEAFRRLLREFPETAFAAESAMVCGRYFEENGMFAEATSMYSLVAAEYSESEFVPAAVLRRAYSLHQMGGRENLDSAEQLLRHYLATQSTLLDEATYQLAWLYLDTGRFAPAGEMFQQIIDDYPDSRYWSDAAYRMAEERLAAGDLESADQLLQQLLEMPTKSGIAVRVRFLLGQIEVQRRNWPAALAHMQTALSQTDDESLRKKSRYWMAESLYQTGDHAAALEQWQRLTDDPDLLSVQRKAWIHLRRAQCHVSMENWPAAIALAQSGLRKYPDFQAAHEFDFVIGQSHAAQGRLADARKSYEKVVSSSTGRTTKTAAMAQWRIGETWFHQREYEKAIAAFYKVDSLYTYRNWRAAALLEAGKCQEHLGNWRHAVRLYQQLIDQFPESELRALAQDRLRLATRQARRTRVIHNK